MKKKLDKTSTAAKRDGLKDLKDTPPKPKIKFTRAKSNQYKL
jgi:hypothetical protein